VRTAFEPQPSSSKKPSAKKAARAGGAGRSLMKAAACGELKKRILFGEFAQEQFHGNGESVRAMEGLRGKIHRLIVRVVTRNANRLGHGYEEHVRIAEAVIHRDPREAERMILKRQEDGKAILLSSRRS
jgi:DNA-binding FadR family transcriptional regulator